MTTAFTNISPITSAYTNFNHFLYLKKIIKAKKVFVCIWDNFVYEDPRFHKDLDSKKDKFQKLSENVVLLEKFMKSLDLNYRILYLSEAWDRLFKKTQYSQIYQKIMSRITIEDLKKGFSIKYIPYNEISLSRMNYIVVDFLIASNLPDLFPELTDKKPTYYLSSERFKVFRDGVISVLKESYGYLNLPEIILVKNVPVILDHQGVIPSLNMSLETIKRIFTEHYAEKEVTHQETRDFLDVLNHILKDSFRLKGEKVSTEELLKSISIDDKKLVADILAENLYVYFEQLKKNISHNSVEQNTKSFYIAQEHDFTKLQKLNPLKLRILQECNGSQSSLDIAKKTGLNKNTVAPYLTQLRNLGLITNERKPSRHFNSFVLDIESIQLNGGKA